MAAGGNVITDIDSVSEAYQQVRSDDNEIEWLCLNYDDKNIVLKGTGRGYQEMCDNFTADERCYAYYRMTTGDDMSIRAKFVLFTWIGASVPPLKKAKVSTDKAFVKAIIVEYAKEFLADNLEDIDEQKVKEIVAKSGGAAY